MTRQTTARFTCCTRDSNDTVVLLARLPTVPEGGSRLMRLAGCPPGEAASLGSVPAAPDDRPPQAQERASQEPARKPVRSPVAGSGVVAMTSPLTMRIAAGKPTAMACWTLTTPRARQIAATAPRVTPAASHHAARLAAGQRGPGSSGGGGSSPPMSTASPVAGAQTCLKQAIRACNLPAKYAGQRSNRGCDVAQYECCFRAEPDSIPAARFLAAATR